MKRKRRMLVQKGYYCSGNFVRNNQFTITLLTCMYLFRYLLLSVLCNNENIIQSEVLGGGGGGRMGAAFSRNLAKIVSALQGIYHSFVYSKVIVPLIPLSYGVWITYDRLIRVQQGLLIRIHQYSDFWAFIPSYDIKIFFSCYLLFICFVFVVLFNFTSLRLKEIYTFDWFSAIRYKGYSFL